MSKFQQMKRKAAVNAAAALNKSTKLPQEEKSLDFSNLAIFHPLPQPSQRRKYAIDQTPSSTPYLTTTSTNSSTSLLLTPLSQRDMQLPSGYLTDSASPDDSSSSPAQVKKDLEKKEDLVYNSALAVGTGPGKQLFMTAFMLWMSGNGLQIFSIMMLGMAFWTPISKLAGMSTEFARYENSNVNITLPKLAFVACNLAGIGLALWKCQSLGLLPTAPADWISTAVRPV